VKFTHFSRSILGRELVFRTKNAVALELLSSDPTAMQLRTAARANAVRSNAQGCALERTLPEELTGD
jgi:hypothetical protein